jgi:hypothetical protein
MLSLLALPCSDLILLSSPRLVIHSYGMRHPSVVEIGVESIPRFSKSKI